MTFHLFFYGAGWVFDFAGVALVALMFVECVAEGAFPFFRLAADSLVYVFLAAAMVHTCGWFLEAAGVMKADEVYEHYKFLNVRWGLWLELGAVFAPLLLWISPVRTQPGGVLAVTTVSVAAWVVTVFCFYSGVRF